MNDIELPEGVAFFAEYGGDVYTAAQVRAAVEADRAKRVPDVAEIRRVLACVKSSVDSGIPVTDGWRILDALLASTPAQPAQQEPNWWRKRADEIEVTVARSGSTEAMRCFTDMRTLLQAATAHQEPPQQERKPMTDEQAVKCIEAAGFKTWTSAHFRIVKQAERHHGIRE